MAALPPGPEHAKKQEDGAGYLAYTTHAPRLPPGHAVAQAWWVPPWEWMYSARLFSLNWECTAPGISLCPAG
jgi:hypothetical protein